MRLVKRDTSDLSLQLRGKIWSFCGEKAPPRRRKLQRYRHHSPEESLGAKR